MIRELLEKNPTVAEVAIKCPASMRVFEKLGIDYCCGGQRSVAEAVREKGATLEEIAQAVESASEPAQEKDWTQATLTELADHIEAVYHTFLKSELPRLSDLFMRVLEAHEEKHGRTLLPLRDTYESLQTELESHMLKEEQVLFPMIRTREASASPEVMGFPIEAPISVMEQEHLSAANALASMRQITGNYSLPDDACPSFHNLYQSLQALEENLHRHIHLENNILFPRAIQQGRSTAWM